MTSFATSWTTQHAQSRRTAGRGARQAGRLVGRFVDEASRRRGGVRPEDCFNWHHPRGHRDRGFGARTSSGKGASAGQPDPAQARLAAGQGAGLARIPGDAAADARIAAQHRLRGSRLPEHRRVLEGKARDGHDPRPGVHARLHLLQCRDRPARPARPARAAARRRGGRGARAVARRRHLGRPRRSRRRRGRAVRAHHRGDPRRGARPRRSRS